MEPRARASPEQFAVIIEFMERHGDLSRPQPGPQGRIRGDRLWLELSALLNSMGAGVQKSQDKWKKVWADWKTKTKKKYLGIQQHSSGTGGGPSSKQTLTALEERVIAVIGVSAVVGLAGIQEQGFNRTSALVQEERTGLGNIIEVPHSQNIALPSPPSPCISTPLLIEHTAPSSPPPPPVPSTAPLSAPRTHPAQSQPTSRRHPSGSPPSTPATPRRSLLRARRNRGLTPFDRAASEFVAVEQRRLQHEESRDRHLHEREMERLRLDSLRIQVDREHNQLLQQLSFIAQRLIDVLTQQQQVASLASTDILPNTE